MTELPLVVIDVQRGGPSTGLPTKTEQADLLQAMFGRNGEAPVPIVGAAVTRRLLRRRRRGRADRRHLPHAGDAALRRLPGQRLRAVADPRARRAPADRPGVRHRDQPRVTRQGGRDQAGLLALPARRGRPSPDRGRSPARRVSSTASVGSRRAMATGTSPTTPATTTTWSASARPRSTGSPTRCRHSRSTTLREGQGPRAGLGLDVRPDRRGLPPRAQGRPRRGAGPPASPEPVPQRPRRDPQAVRRRDDPRDEPRPALAADPRRSTSSTWSATTTCAACP